MSDLVKQKVDERIVNLDKMLDEYTSKLGLNFLKHDNACEIILNYTQVDLRNLSEEECGENAYVLIRFSGYIQKECGRLQARMKWLQRCIEIETADKIRTYGDKFTSFQERLLLAHNDRTNEYMSKLQDLMMHCEIRKEEISFISNKISAMADTLLKLKQVKRSEKWAQ